MSKIICESGMHFGEYATADVFHIEESAIFEKLKKTEGIKTIEFILKWETGAVVFIEAKSSFPDPNNRETPEKFDERVNEVYEKFSHAMEIYFAAILNRQSDDKGDIPKYFKTVNYGEVDIKFWLVINGHHESWLPPVSEALRRMLRIKLKIWGMKPMDVIAINRLQAESYGLLHTT